MACFAQFHARRFSGLETVNQAFLCLLPKKQDAAHIKDYRPIRLNHAVGKFIAKVLANRLSHRLPEIVGQHQRAAIYTTTSCSSKTLLDICIVSNELLFFSS